MAGTFLWEFEVKLLMHIIGETIMVIKMLQNVLIQMFPGLTPTYSWFSTGLVNRQLSLFEQMDFRVENPCS